ncbi:MAG: Phosphoserine phosphatase RsbU [Firmicutes bacterium ADurb.Bin248]|nr:MAG: Phosphoserine phosphatase RsbU [Firmicutes bacterium ADurb.Bin248]HOF99645.1 SpoIIE family protein phosphatase [Clostridia bacterium]HPK15712.1 SpoIIE family protein phosphatase [Clostridia bacterium]
MKKQKNIRVSLGLKTALGILFIAAVLSGVAVVFGYQTYKTALEEQLIGTAYNLAQTIASEVDADSIDRYLAGGVADEAYFETREHLLNIQQSNDIVYAVVVKPTEEGFYYIYDTDQSDEAFQLGDFQAFYPGDFLDNKANFLAGNPIAPIVTNYEFGWLVSALVPVVDDGGAMRGYVDVDLSMNGIKAMEQDFLTKLAAILIGLTLLLAAGLLFATHRIMVVPINRLAAATGDFVRRREREDGPRGVLELPGLDTKDELGHLYRSIRRMEQDIYAYIDDLTAVTAEKERIGAELDVARNIQASMLPCIFPPFPERPELDIYASMAPAKEVGGDFYDFFLIDDDRLAIVMADVSGKGVPAALFMVIAKTLIKNSVQAGLSPKAVLRRVNGQLCENNDAQMFVTVWLGILDISTGRLTCANAGHEYPAIRRAGGDFELIRDKHDFVLGGMESARYGEYELFLAPGDRLFLYTDGVTEATDAHNGLYGAARMLSALNRGKDGGCEALLRRVKEDIDAFAGSAPQFDDITMLGLELRAQPGRSMKKLRLKPSVEAIGEATAFAERELAAAGAAAKTVAQVNVAVDEILSNIARYSGATEVTVGVLAQGGAVTLRFADNGRRYDPTQKAAPDIRLPAGERDAGGLGIFMVKKTMDGMAYEYRDGLNILTLTKNLG